MINNLVITGNVKLKAFGEHSGKEYKVYFNNISSELMYLSFDAKWKMENFLYESGFGQYTYKSSNGSQTIKKWEYIQTKLDYYAKYYATPKKPLPLKYTLDDWRCGHFIKVK